MAIDREIMIPVVLSEKTFKRFARFDMLRLRKRWVRPAVFAALLLAFGTAALLLRKPQSGLIAAVLYAVGLGLPLVYFGFFFSQVNMQAVRLKLDQGRRVYTVWLGREGVSVQNDLKKEDPLRAPWEEIQAAFRAKDCVYLYVSPTRAFLLPHGQANAAPEAVWEFLTRHLTPSKCRILRF